MSELWNILFDYSVEIVAIALLMAAVMWLCWLVFWLWKILRLAYYASKWVWFSVVAWWEGEDHE